MKCPYCLSTDFEEGEFTVAQVYGERPVILRRVPAHRCEQCGELILDGKVAVRIEQAVAGAAEGSMSVDVYDLARVVSDAR